MTTATGHVLTVQVLGGPRLDLVVPSTTTPAQVVAAFPDLLPAGTVFVTTEGAPVPPGTPLTGPDRPVLCARPPGVSSAPACPSTAPGGTTAHRSSLLAAAAVLAIAVCGVLLNAGSATGWPGVLAIGWLWAGAVLSLVPGRLSHVRVPWAPLWAGAGAAALTARTSTGVLVGLAVSALAVLGWAGLVAVARVGRPGRREPGSGAATAGPWCVGALLVLTSVGLALGSAFLAGVESWRVLACLVLVLTAHQVRVLPHLVAPLPDEAVLATARLAPEHPVLPAAFSTASADWLRCHLSEWVRGGDTARWVGSLACGVAAVISAGSLLLRPAASEWVSVPTRLLVALVAVVQLLSAAGVRPRRVSAVVLLSGGSLLALVLGCWVSGPAPATVVVALGLGLGAVALPRRWALVWWPSRGGFVTGLLVLVVLASVAASGLLMWAWGVAA